MLLGKMQLLQKAFLSKVLSDALIFPYTIPYLCFNEGCTAGSPDGKNQHMIGEERSKERG